MAYSRRSPLEALEVLREKQPWLAERPVLRLPASDLGLTKRGARRFQPRNPLFATGIFEHPCGGVAVEMAGYRLRIASARTGLECLAVDDKAFFPNALEDTDLVLATNPFGVEVSMQVRSAAAPEEATLELESPEDVRLRAVGRAPAGAVEVLRAHERLALIDAPGAWDADREPVEVGYAVEGRALLLHYPHRDRDLLYPLAIARV
jgi:hypothetical protein